MWKDRATRLIERVFDWYQADRQRALVGCTLLVTAGSIIIYGAIRNSAIVAGGIGCALVALGIFPINDLVRNDCRRRRWTWLLIGGCCIGIAVALMIAALTLAAPWFALLAVIPGTVGFLAYGSLLRLFAGERELATIVTGLIAVAMGAGTWFVSRDHWRLAFLVITVGVLTYRTGLAGWLTTQTRVRRAALLGLAGVTIGVGALAGAASAGHLSNLAAWAIPTTLSLHLVSVAASSDIGRQWREHNSRWRSFSRPARVIAWLVVLSTWATLVTRGSQPLLIGSAIAVAIAALGAAFVWRGEFVLTALLLGFLVVWVSLDRTGSYEPPVGSTDGRIVALGDSYISGEGARTFLEGTNVAGSAENQCRRAPTAYPILIAKALNKELDFVACSGAKAANIHVEGQMPHAAVSPPGSRPQLENVDPEVKIDFVLVSIGGNDARFSDVAKTCLLPGQCAQLEHLWLEPTESLATEIIPAYEAIRSHVGVETPIIAMPYPIMVTEMACADAMLTSSEHEFIVRFVNEINAQVQLAAKRTGIHYFDPGIDAFTGDRICDDDEVAPASVNFISLAPTVGPFLDRLNPNNWIHGSFHPNADGHKLTAKAFLEKTNGTPGPNPTPDPTAELAVSAEPAVPAPSPFGRRPDVDTWRRARIIDAVQEAWLIPLLLFMGGWVAAITGRDGPFRQLDWTDVRQARSRTRSPRRSITGV